MTLVNAETGARRNVPIREWIAANDGEPFLYGFRAEGTPYVKIGYSSDPLRRLERIQALAPQPLDLLGLTPGNAADEALVHRRLDPWRHRGEWFDIDAAALAFEPHLGLRLSPWNVIRFAAGFLIPGADGVLCHLGDGRI